jgi:hypothetical protein
MMVTNAARFGTEKAWNRCAEGRIRQSTPIFAPDQHADATPPYINSLPLLGCQAAGLTRPSSI